MQCSDTTGSARDICDGVDNDCNPATADGSAEATLGAPILGISKAALIDIQRQWLSEPCEIVIVLRDVPAEREGALPLVEGHVITVLSKAAGEVFHAVVDGKFTIVDVVIPEGWYAGSDNDAFGRQGIFPAAACGEPVDCHADAFEEEEVRVVSETTRRDDVQPSPVFSAEEVLRIQGVVRKVPVADSVVRYAVRLAASSRPGQAGAPDFVNEWVNWGAGLRAGQALILGGKARALLQGRAHVTPDDVKALAVPVLRHRILPNFKAEAEGVDADKVVEKLLETVPVP